jgi:outer membrane receptor for Fe3+-dicitrate
MNREDSLIVTLYSDDSEIDFKKVSAKSNSVNKTQLDLIKQKIENNQNLKIISNDISAYMDQMNEKKLNKILI